MASPVSSLSCRIAPPEEYPTITKVAGDWNGWVFTRLLFIRNLGFESDVVWDRKGKRIDWFPNLVASMLICGDVPIYFDESEDKDETKNFDQAYVCQDANARIQGIVFTQTYNSTLEIVLLATNPKNFPSSHPKESGEKEAENVGRTLVTHLIQECQKDHKYEKIVLSPKKSSEPFYEKMGFEKKGEEMVLTINKVAALQGKAA